MGNRTIARKTGCGDWHRVDMLNSLSSNSCSYSALIGNFDRNMYAKIERHRLNRNFTVVLFL